MVLAVSLALILTGCQPGERGQTGLMLGADGFLYGVVHMCRGSVSEFSLNVSADFSDVRVWQFDEPVDRAGSVQLGSPTEVADLLDAQGLTYFAASTPNQTGITSPLYMSNVEYAATIDFAALMPGEVTYVGWQDRGDGAHTIVTTVASFDDFTELSCDGY